MQHWTFGQKIAAGFAAIVMLALVTAVVAVISLRSVVNSSEQVISTSMQMLIDAERLHADLERKVAEGRAYMLTGEDRFIDRLRDSRSEFYGVLDRLRRQAIDDTDRTLLEAIGAAEQHNQAMLEQIFGMRRANASGEAISKAFDDKASPARDAADVKLRAFVARQEKLVDEAKRSAADTANRAILTLAAIALTIVVAAAALALLLTRALGRQIGAAVGHVQSSSAELQAAANQQATGAREQATAMSEITTTISELLATSRQIAESAQRVAQIAEQTASAAQVGEGTVAMAHESISGIRRQVDQIVNHMLGLGKKSQQIGAVLDIVSELAEQTNILAINATIEAAGAGESGRRFAVVADEIRELANRVGGSTKEIRSLIDDVRSAVNTTVMATETGSKAVDSGARQFGEVAAAFKQIANQVTATTEAAREIELSTKQQSSAVEQVNVAVANVAQTTKETEVSSGQTLETVSQLASLSRDLLRLVQPQAAR